MLIDDRGYFRRYIGLRSMFADIRRPHFLNRPLASIPQQVAGWMLMADRSLSVRVEKKLAASDYISRVYTKDGKQLDLFVAYYADQRTGEGMHSPKHCLPGAGWEIWKRDSTDIQPHGRRVTINCYSIQRALRRAAVLYWYQDRYRIVASEYTAKFMLLKDGFYPAMPPAH